MNASTAHRAGWVLIGLTVLPVLARSAEPAPSQAEKLEWLVAAHDVRYAIPAPSAKPSECRSREESGR